MLDLGLQPKKTHWNVNAPHLMSLHGLFDRVAAELEEFTDDYCGTRARPGTGHRFGFQQSEMAYG